MNPSPVLFSPALSGDQEAQAEIIEQIKSADTDT